MRKVMASIGALAVALQPVAAQEVAVSNVKAGMLASMCERPVDALSMDPCNSFIVAAADGLQFGSIVCIKDTSGYAYVVVGVVRKYLVDHPEDYGLPAVAVVAKALREKFACTRRP